MGITLKDGKLDFTFDSPQEGGLNDLVKNLASDAVSNLGGTTLKAAGITAAGVGLTTAAVAGGSSIGAAATGSAMVAGSVIIANEAMKEAQQKEGIDVIKHQRPVDMTSIPASCPQGTKADNISLINESLVAAGLLHVEEVETHRAMPEIQGCVPQQAARRSFLSH